MARTVQERSTNTITARAKSKDGALFTPTTVRYRLDDLDTKRELIAWTSVTPASAVAITIPGAKNAMIKTNRKRERKVLTVQFDQGLDSEVNSEYIYWVKNLHFAQVA